MILYRHLLIALPTIFVAETPKLRETPRFFRGGHRLENRHGLGGHIVGLNLTARLRGSDEFLMGF
jgi:hypothetical protein